MTIKIRPLAPNQGYGFFAMQPVDFDVTGYRYEQVGRYHNYHFTGKNTRWPVAAVAPGSIVKIDGFSPNLNKLLHVGHLRNLALAKSLETLTQTKNVALLGKSLGVLPEAEKELEEWFSFINYDPETFSDTEVCEQFSVERYLTTEKGDGEYTGCTLWQGAKSPVVIRRSDGRTTYAYHDLAFANLVGPTHYLTGAEQKEHFENLGLGSRHLPMGLILSPETGKKMKSRDGNALSAKEALQMVMDCLDSTPEAKKLAWNILAWNFLHISRGQDLKFEHEKWSKPDQPGLYITYTLARLNSALKDVEHQSFNNCCDLQSQDLALLGTANYFSYWRDKAIEAFDPAPLANYAHDLARVIGTLYHTEPIATGRPAFQYAAFVAASVLASCMLNLGMFPLQEI